MKFLDPTFLIIFLTIHLGVFAQIKPTPKVSPTAVSPEIRESELRTRKTTVKAVSPKTVRDLNAATELMKSGRHEEAIAAWSAIIKTQPKLNIAFNNRGYSYLQLKKFDLAIADFNSSIRLQPSASTYNNRGMAQSKKGDFQSALADYFKAVELNPNESLSYNNRADTYMQLSKFDLALADQTKAISMLPKEAIYLANRCYTYLKLQSLEPAMADCNKAIELKPDFALAYSTRANINFLISDFNAAVRDFETAIKLNDSLVGLNLDLGYVLLQTGKPDEALKCFSKIISVQPTALAYIYRATAYAKLDDLDSALADLAKAAETDPNNALIYNNRGTYLLKKGDRKGALADFTKAIELNPKMILAYKNRAYLYQLFGETEKSAADQKAAEMLESGSGGN